MLPRIPLTLRVKNPSRFLVHFELTGSRPQASPTCKGSQGELSGLPACLKIVKRKEVTVRNRDPFAPWNDPMAKDDPFAPHNDSMGNDDPFKPWNDPMGRETDLTQEERDYYNGRR